MLWEVGGLQDVVGRYLEEEDERNIDGDNKETGVDRVNREDKDEGGNGNEEQIRRKRKRNARVLFGGEPLGLNPNIRVYRYSKGQFFAKHCKYSIPHLLFYLSLVYIRIHTHYTVRRIYDVQHGVLLLL